MPILCIFKKHELNKTIIGTLERIGGSFLKLFMFNGFISSAKTLINKSYTKNA